MEYNSSQTEWKLTCRRSLNHIDDALEAIEISKDVCERHSEAIFCNLILSRETSLLDVGVFEVEEKLVASSILAPDLAKKLG